MVDTSTAASGIHLQLPDSKRDLFIIVDDVDNEEYQERMHSDDSKFIVTCERYPSVFKDPTYPDFLVVWDHGEGPHNPESFEHVSQNPSEMDSWYYLTVYPQWVWDLARRVVDDHGLKDEYVVIWFKGDDRG